MVFDPTIPNDFAYPSTDKNEPHMNGYRGISMRDYFAAAALPSIMNNSGTSDGVKWQDTLAACASLAYIVADAMLKERIK